MILQKETFYKAVIVNVDNKTLYKEIGRRLRDEDDGFWSGVETGTRYVRYTPSTPHRHFYQVETRESESKNIFYTVNVLSTEITENVDTIKKYYADPFSEVEIIHFYRYTTYDEETNKIRFRLSYRTRRREVNNRYFRRENDFVVSLTVDLNNGDFYIFHHELGRKVVRKNYFYILKFFVDYFETHKDVSRILQYQNLGPVTEHFKKEISDGSVAKGILREYMVKNGFAASADMTVLEMVTDFFCYKKGVRDCNKDYLFFHYPGIKLLRKNNMKLDYAILDKYNINTKFTRKLIRQHSDKVVDVSILAEYGELFGKELMGRMFATLYEAKPQLFFAKSAAQYANKDSFLQIIVDLTISKKEKENIVHVIIDSKQETLRDFHGILLDHLNLMRVATKYNEKTNFTARTWRTFHQQHLQLSKFIIKLKRPYTTQYIYAQETIDTIEEPITPNFKPFILKNEDDYIEEGEYMKHCVGVYVDNEKSVIVSIRDGEDRITCEYNIQSGKPVQHRHFCNNKPPTHFQQAIDELNYRVYELALVGRLNWVKKEKRPNVVNGIRITPEILEMTDNVSEFHF